MSLRLIVPVKTLARGKSRLAAVLDDSRRRTLNRRFLRQTLATATRCVEPADIVVISDGADARVCARACGAGALAQTGSGLNEALDQARRAARCGGAETLVILASDLPFLTPQDIDRLLVARTAPEVLVIARDRARRGTNALVLPAAGDFRFRFGVDSAAAHAAEAARCGWRAVTVDHSNLSFDVDTPADYAAFAARERITDETSPPGGDDPGKPC